VTESTKRYVTQKDKARAYDLLNIYYGKPQKFKDAVVVARSFSK